MDAINFCRAHAEALLTAPGFLSGIVIHNAVFISGEWHIQAPQIFLQLVALFIACPVLASILQDTLVGGIFSAIVSWSHGYLAGLVTSILVYRVLLHPLTKAGFPGPWYARCTKLWHVWASRTSMNHHVLNDLYKKYGAFVRTGTHHRNKNSDSFLKIEEKGGCRK